MATASPCPGSDVTRKLAEAVSCYRWTEVIKLLQTPGCGEEERHGAIEEMLKRAHRRFVDDNIDNILEACADDQLDSVLSRLLQRRAWRCVGHVLRRDVSDALHKRAVLEAAVYADDEDFVHHVWPWCLDEELEAVTDQLVSQGQWVLVGEVLERGISRAQHLWAVEEALGQAHEEHFANHLLRHCADEDLDQVVRCMVSRGIWEPVAGVTHSDGNTSQHVLSQLVSQDLWEAAGKFLQRNIGRTQHRWAVEQALGRADDHDLVHYVLPECHGEELEFTITHLVSRGLWGAVGKALERGISSSRHRWAIDQASRHADDGDFAHCLLPHCHPKDLEQVITCLVSRGLWRSVGKALEKGVGAAKHRWAIEEALMHADEEDFADHILLQCTTEDLKQVIKHMVSQGLWEPMGSTAHTDAHISQHVLSQIVTQGLWKAVGRFLQQDIDYHRHSWAVEQALQYADHHDFVHFILPECRYGELELVVGRLVSQGLWGAVGKVLERGVNPATHRWAIGQASRHADDGDFARCLLPHCHPKDQEQVITCLVSRGLWRSVGKALEKGVDAAKHRWAVEEALMHADEEDFADHILRQCTTEDLKQVVKHMVSQGLWEPMDSIIHSDTQISHHILSQITSRGLWKAVGRFLHRGISYDQHRWAVEQAAGRADDHDFVHYILPECRDEELQLVIIHLVSRGVWDSVGKVLVRGVSSAQRRWAIGQASRYADDSDFAHYVSPHCHEEDQPVVLPTLLSRGLWQSVGKLLSEGADTAQHRWAVGEALKHADEQGFVEHILPRCTEEDLEQVLTHMASQRLWEPPDNTTGRDINFSRHILSQLVSRGLWEAAGRFLQRDIGTAQRTWAVGQASRCADDADLVHFILPQCRQEDLKHVTAHLVGRGLWWSVGQVLERGLSPAQHRWAVTEAMKNAEDSEFADYILPQCRTEQLDEVITHLVSRGLWQPMGEMLERWMTADQHRRAVVEASKHADDESFARSVLHHCNEDEIIAVFPHLVANKMWKSARRILYDVVRDTLCLWMTPGDKTEAHTTMFWKFIHYCQVEVSRALDLTKAVAQETLYCSYDHSIVMISSDLGKSLSWKRRLRKLLMISLVHTLCYVLCHDRREYKESTHDTEQCVADVYTLITACINENRGSVTAKALTAIQNKKKWTSEFAKIADARKSDPLFHLHFLQGLHLYHVSRRGKNDDAILQVVLAVFPLFPQLQSVALTMMLRERRWDVISQACLSHAWEHDRRRLFKAAVLQRQWDVVRQWCDHTVHDDQREWAMTEAFNEKQWEVYVVLADHGLTVWEQMHAHYMVAKYGDWRSVLLMVKRGGDITEVCNLLENWVTGNLRKKPEGDVTVYVERCLKLIRLRLRFAKNSARSPMKALERCKWGSVLFNILHKPTKHYFSRVLDKVIEEQEWHILTHLVRLGINATERNRLFPEMVKQQQWGVCRQLLEFGVDDQLCLDALPVLIEQNQWTLAAMVLEYDIDDAVKRQVMFIAFQRREGALFWHGLTTMKDQQHLPMITRERLFHQAISRDIWQAVKPLVDDKDASGIQHRDVAFLEAIEQHLWDVVDHCQRRGADINMEDENGETPLHREARKREWTAVEEIVFRDGKPNILDKDGVSVLNRLIDHEEWDIVKMVIKYGGDIHLPARCSEYFFDTQKQTPLQVLIDLRQADVIHFSILWCGDQKKGVNDRGERVLHAVCDSNRWDVMEDLMVRKVDPLAVTETGKSPLVYAVLNAKCPQRMVAECSRQGFASHQPSVTGPHESVLDNIIRTVVRMWDNGNSHCDYMRWESPITSPLVFAVLRDLPVVILSLHESQSCSYAELVTLFTQLPRLTDLDTREGRKLFEATFRRRGRETDQYLQLYSGLMRTVEKYTAFLGHLVMTPRTLMSACRLLVLNHFHYSDTKRFERLGQLPLPVPLKNYLEFSDLCDPDYGKHVGLPSDDQEGDESSERIYLSGDSDDRSDTSSDYERADACDDED